MISKYFSKRRQAELTSEEKEEIQKTYGEQNTTPEGRIKGTFLLDNLTEIQIPSEIKYVDRKKLSSEDNKKILRLVRKEYQRKYYQENREKARAYQKKYQEEHSKKRTQQGKNLRGTTNQKREEIKKILTHHDIMYAPTEKSQKMLEDVLKGERFLIM